LFGTTPLEIATIDIWIRRVEWQLMSPIGQIWRHAHPYTAALLTQYKDFGESNRAHADRAYHWLDREMADKAFIAGDSFSAADIMALSIVDFGTFIGTPIPDDCGHLKAWHERVSARPSAVA
jgi:glutathione S-transferase